MKVSDFQVIQLRQENGREGGSSRPVIADREKDETRDERQIMCAHCRHLITTKQCRLEVDGAHEHTFFNPAGIVYEIGCYSKAIGCMPSGPPTAEFSWFRGYEWRFSLCSSCFTHLGWHYESAGSSFFGLIFSKLIF